MKPPLFKLESNPGERANWAKFAFTRAKMEDKRRDIAEDAGWIIADLDHGEQAEEGQ